MVEVIGATHTINCSLKISGSKSISNRLLILNEVLNLKLSFENLSDSDDTQLLQNALAVIKNKSSAVINVQHAGSDMRFLTALLAITSGEWTLTGSERMKQRPIGELVNGLKKLGANIQYLEQENFPPIKINGKKLMGGSIEIDGSQSSQFISALLLIAPTLERGLELKLKGTLVSRPYIDMTLDLLKQFGVKITNTNQIIHIKHSTFNIQHSTFLIESDWSSASYWYSICALSPKSTVALNYFSKKSLQADSVLPKLYEQLGVITEYNENGIILTNTATQLNEFNYDFTNCPDIAQTIAVTCFGLGIKATLIGLQTLKIKETDRILALKTELEKLGAMVQIANNSISIQSKPNFQLSTFNFQFSTYNDHRMAMSFAPLAGVYHKILIQHPHVVSKSYPTFWEDLKTAGFSVNLPA